MEGVDDPSGLADAIGIELAELLVPFPKETNGEVLRTGCVGAEKLFALSSVGTRAEDGFHVGAAIQYKDLAFEHPLSRLARVVFAFHWNKLRAGLS